MSQVPAVLPVSVIVMTRNEAANIERCLLACAGMAEIFVVDSGSTDHTISMAEACGAHVVPFVWDGQYPKKKQWCLDNLPISQPWILFLDADEYPTPALLEELARVCRAVSVNDRAVADDPVGYYIRAHVSHDGRMMRYGRKHCKLALLRNGYGQFPVIDDLDVPGGWEVEGHYQPVVNGTVGRLDEYLVHDDLKPPRAWRDRHENYAQWSAHMRLRRALTGVEQTEPLIRRMIKALLYHLPGRPLFAFLDSYALCRGFLDGRTGFAYAMARYRYYAAIDKAHRFLIQQPDAGPSPAAAATTMVKSDGAAD